MRPIFLTQSGSLRMFQALHDDLKARGDVEAAGFLVSHAGVYADHVAQTPEFEQAGHAILKEWEVTGRRDSGKPDLAVLRRYEDELGAPGLFGAIVADRRLLMGPDCTYTQDYRRRFSDDQLLRILQDGAEAIDRLFDQVKPDVVVGFICVTFLEYLGFLFAKARGIRYLNLRPTRIGNNVGLYGSLTDPGPEFAAAYRRILTEGSPRLEEARAHVARVRGGEAKYEGVVAASDKTAAETVQAARTDRREPLAKVGKLLGDYRAYRNGPAAADNHVPHPLRALTFQQVLNPLRAQRVKRALDPLYVRPEDLAGRRLAFCPLHTEPEVTLLVYSRPYVNQIEAVRAFALSLPADMLLVVKEHPWMVGKRSLDSYHKLLDIPRVRLAPPSLPATPFVKAADLVTVVCGSVALEAMFLGTPAVALGPLPMEVLPPTMYRRVGDLTRLQAEIADLLATARFDDTVLEAYVAAVLETSAPVNLYSSLLGRPGVHSVGASAFDENVQLLSDHIVAWWQGSGTA